MGDNDNQEGENIVEEEQLASDAPLPSDLVKLIEGKKDSKEAFLERRNFISQEYKEVESEARSNLQTRMTLRTGALTGIFAAATGTGIVLLREPTTANAALQLFLVASSVVTALSFNRNLTHQDKIDQGMLRQTEKKRQDLHTNKEIRKLEMPTYKSVREMAENRLSNKDKKLKFMDNDKVIGWYGAALLAVTLMGTSAKFLANSNSAPEVVPFHSHPVPEAPVKPRGGRPPCLKLA